MAMFMSPEHPRNGTTTKRGMAPMAWARMIMMAHPAMIVQRPDVVAILTESQRTFRIIYTDGRGHPHDIGDYPEWMGSSIGRWDGDTLITWTSNIQGWKTHAAFEHSSQMQTIEIYSSRRDAAGNFQGLTHEAILYDPEALVEPIRIVRNFDKVSGFEEGDPYAFVECVQTIFPVEGKSTPLTPGAEFTYVVPDMYGRPWAQIWERYHEAGMERPPRERLFGFD